MLIDNRTKNKIITYMPDSGVMNRLTNFFDVFSDGTRLKIISMLLISSMCVTDISELAEINQTTVSHQLKILKNFGIVEAKRQGKVVFYSIASNKIGDLLLSGVECILPSA